MLDFENKHRKTCSWCHGLTPSYAHRPMVVEVRHRRTGKTGKPRLCARCVGEHGAIWFGHEAVDPDQLAHVRETLGQPPAPPRQRRLDPAA